MLKRFLKKKVKSDSGSSALVSFILLVPLFLGIIATGVDFSFYFANRGQVEAVARDAARTVAIFGGNGSSTQSTTIEKSYGTSKAVACSVGRTDIANAPNKYIFVNANRTNLTSVECNVLASLANNGGLISFAEEVPVIVKCGPNSASAVGTRTYCSITYKYGGIPGSPLSFIQIRNSDGSEGGMLSTNVVTKSSESEVKNPGLVNR